MKSTANLILEFSYDKVGHTIDMRFTNKKLPKGAGDYYHHSALMRLHGRNLAESPLLDRADKAGFAEFCSAYLGAMIDRIENERLFINNKIWPNNQGMTLASSLRRGSGSRNNTKWTITKATAIRSGQECSNI